MDSVKIFSADFFAKKCAFPLDNLLNGTIFAEREDARHIKTVKSIQRHRIVMTQFCAFLLLIPKPHYFVITLKQNAYG